MRVFVNDLRLRIFRLIGWEKCLLVQGNEVKWNQLNQQLRGPSFLHLKSNVHPIALTTHVYERIESHFLLCYNPDKTCNILIIVNTSHHVM